jgi:hypothetical protein
VTNLNDLGAKLLSPADIRQLFPDAWWHEVFEFQNDKVPVHFIEGGLAIDSLEAGRGPWCLVVHGDLDATGDLDFETTDYKTSLLVVFGTVRARNFRYTNGATCVVEHDLIARDYVFGRYGDESARLSVSGTLRARALLLDHVTPADATEIEAIICTVEGWGLPIDIDYYANNRDVLDAAVLKDDGRIHHELAWRAAISGQPVLLPEAEARLSAVAAARSRLREESSAPR